MESFIAKQSYTRLGDGDFSHLLRLISVRCGEWLALHEIMFLLLLFLLSSGVDAQEDHRNSLTFSGGYGRAVGSYCCQENTAVSLGATYGYRILRHLQADVGVTVALNPSPEIRGATYDVKPDDRFIWVPFGLRGVLPLGGGRFELSAGGGGLYEQYSISNPFLAAGLISRGGWGGYLTGGAAVALDRSRRFWLGATPRWYLTNTTSPYDRNRWFVITGDIGIRF